MKKNTRILAVLLAITAVIALCIFAFAADEEEYMGSDLPVSESYVLRAIRALDEKFTGKIDALANEFEKFRSDIEKKPANNAQSQTDISYTVVTLKKGQKLLGNCEIILRSGKALAVCPGENGISDLTAGADLPNGNALEANHLLVVPRDDGRGLLADSGTVYVMVRGTYRIEN